LNSERMGLNEIPVSELWTREVLRSLLARGRVTAEELVGAVEARVAESLRSEMAGCVGGEIVEPLAGEIATAWVAELRLPADPKRLLAEARERARGRAAGVVLERLIARGVVARGSVIATAIEASEAVAVLPEDAWLLIEALFGEAVSDGLRTCGEDGCGSVA